MLFLLFIFTDKKRLDEHKKAVLFTEEYIGLWTSVNILFVIQDRLQRS